MRHNKQMNAGTVQTWVSPGAFAVSILSAKLSSKSPCRLSAGRYTASLVAIHLLSA